MRERINVRVALYRIDFESAISDRLINFEATESVGMYTVWLYLVTRRFMRYTEIRVSGKYIFVRAYRHGISIQIN